MVDVDKSGLCTAVEYQVGSPSPRNEAHLLPMTVPYVTYFPRLTHCFFGICNVNKMQVDYLKLVVSDTM
jgi:hypothetical protein